MHDNQPQTGPNAVFNPTTFPKLFIRPLPFLVQFWRNVTRGLNNYSITFPPFYSLLSAKKIEAIRRESHSLSPTHPPSSGPCSAFSPITMGELKVSLRPSPLLESYILMLFQYQGHWSITPSFLSSNFPSSWSFPSDTKESSWPFTPFRLPPYFSAPLHRVLSTLYPLCLLNPIFPDLLPHHSTKTVLAQSINNV